MIYQNSVREFKNSFKCLDYYIELTRELLKYIKQKFNQILKNQEGNKEIIYDELVFLIKENCNTIKEKLEKSDEFSGNLIYNFNNFCMENDESRNENNNSINFKQINLSCKGGFNNVNNSIINESQLNAVKYDFYTGGQSNIVSDNIMNNKLSKIDVGLYDNYKSFQIFIDNEILKLNQSKSVLDNLKVKQF